MTQQGSRILSIAGKTRYPDTHAQDNFGFRKKERPGNRREELFGNARDNRFATS